MLLGLSLVLLVALIKWLLYSRKETKSSRFRSYKP
jgi:hypothetical protein